MIFILIVFFRLLTLQFFFVQDLLILETVIIRVACTQTFQENYSETI
jgi:hypothetical protein